MRASGGSKRTKENFEMPLLRVSERSRRPAKRQGPGDGGNAELGRRGGANGRGFETARTRRKEPRAVVARRLVCIYPGGVVSGGVGQDAGFQGSRRAFTRWIFPQPQYRNRRG